MGNSHTYDWIIDKVQGIFDQAAKLINPSISQRFKEVEADFSSVLDGVVELQVYENEALMQLSLEKCQSMGVLSLCDTQEKLTTYLENNALTIIEYKPDTQAKNHYIFINDAEISRSLHFFRETTEYSEKSLPSHIEIFNAKDFSSCEVAYFQEGKLDREWMPALYEYECDVDEAPSVHASYWQEGRLVEHSASKAIDPMPSNIAAQWI